MSKLTEHPTFRQVAWIGVGVGGLFTLVGAVWLAVTAQSVDPPPQLKETTAAIKPGRAIKRPPLGSRPEGLSRPERRPERLPRPAASLAPEAAVAPPPTPPPAGGTPSPGALDPDRSSLVRPPLPRLSALGGPGMEPGVPGRLSPEELEKRRDERKTRQADRLKNRVKTLEERIQSYRKDGTRTEAQIERMERSLERMRQRLGRMDGGEE